MKYFLALYYNIKKNVFNSFCWFLTSQKLYTFLLVIYFESMSLRWKHVYVDSKSSQYEDDFIYFFNFSLISVASIRNQCNSFYSFCQHKMNVFTYATVAFHSFYSLSYSFIRWISEFLFWIFRKIMYFVCFTYFI